MSRKNIVVFSGGSAANSLVDVFSTLADGKGCHLSYIIPISDNGGSSSEVMRVFGGPGIGDVRSRLVRLIPTTPSTLPLRTLFAHRLTSESPLAARIEWLDIVEARHPLWTDISSSQRELIRSFLNTINLEIVKRARPSSVFNFQSASVGNLFLTGARLFTGSFESAIYLLGAITGVPGGVEVIPGINSNFSYHISAGLTDGTIITGQNAISHPSDHTSFEPTASGIQTPLHPQNPSHTAEAEDANPPDSHPSLRLSSIHFNKATTTLLPSPIQKIWYINPYGQPIRPAANPKVLDALKEAGTVIYSIGSLYTSIIPSLILRGVGEWIRNGGVRYKILILNGCLDRETTSVGCGGYGAMDFVRAVVEACESSLPSPQVVSDASSSTMEDEIPKSTWKNYVTHIIYLVGEGTPMVEREELAGIGIDCVRIYGRKNSEGGMLYDGVALGGALEAIIGKGGDGLRGSEKNRRNTLGFVGV